VEARDITIEAARRALVVLRTGNGNGSAAANGAKLRLRDLPIAEG
jgi:hypothetical protein